jgi:hypothetical protein
MIANPRKNCSKSCTLCDSSGKKTVATTDPSFGDEFDQVLVDEIPQVAAEAEEDGNRLVSFFLQHPSQISYMNNYSSA